jgi:hypothetical protein
VRRCVAEAGEVGAIPSQSIMCVNFQGEVI